MCLQHKQQLGVFEQRDNEGLIVLEKFLQKKYLGSSESQDDRRKAKD